MQVGRLFEIVYILLNRKNITARELSERFEVSVRTIYRDIEVLCQAGIPIYTSKGKGGGIGLLNNFILNKSVLTKEEQQEIITALQGLKATHSTSPNQVLTKLTSMFGTDSVNWIEIDFTDWSDQNREAFQLLKAAVLQRKVIEFDYYNSSGQKTKRAAEPLQLWFKNKNWYLRAFCRTKSGFRLFKLNRMKKICLTNDSFLKIIEPDKLPTLHEQKQLEQVSFTLRIASSQAYRIYDECDEEQISRDEAGYYLVKYIYPAGEWIYDFILSYGNHAEVVEPAYIRGIIKDKLRKALERYC
jgi:predicted DNA-binding transcriptional regulator YafY